MAVVVGADHAADPATRTPSLHGSCHLRVAQRPRLKGARAPRVVERAKAVPEIVEKISLFLCVVTSGETAQCRGGILEEWGGPGIAGTSS